MLITHRSSGLVKRSLLLACSFAAVVSFHPSAAAQSSSIAPQILPYTARLIAGGGTAAIAKGATCPLSGFTSLDAYGDGCLATEIQLTATVTGSGPRFAVADRTGAIFFSDATNGLVRRVDPITGVVTAIAGGAASSPAAGTACGSFTSINSDGDGCLSTAVKISHPMGLAFSASGDLYFADYGFNDVRKIAATNGLVTTGGVISNIAGGTSGGYNVNNTAASPVISATQGYLNSPFGIAFDTAGNLYIADEFSNALEVVNLTAATETIQGLVVPAGTIAKFAGYGNLVAKTPSSGDCPDFVTTTAKGGCYFGSFVNGHTANTSNIDAAYTLAVDASGNVYFANEFNNNVGLVTSANIISTYAGIQGSASKVLTRGPAGSFGIGSDFGVALDTIGNLYVTDASSGVIWRVDAAPGNTMYVVAGGAATVCTANTDTFGDGCPAKQAKFGSSGTGNFASTAIPGPGIFGVSVDAYSNLYTGDTETGLIREIASGTQFGNVGATQTDTIDVHFSANDSAAATGGYTITAGAAIFTLGTPACTTNSDKTTDCLLPITAAPTTLGAFTGTLQVQGQLGGTSTFQLAGNFVQSPVTRTVVSAASSVSCTGATIFSTTTPTNLTATLVANGPSAPGGTITFYSNGTALSPASGVAVTNLGTVAAPLYGAILPNTFSTPGVYTITAVYSGDSYFKTSTTTGPATVTTALPSFSAATTGYQQSTVAAGQTALYSFNITQAVYSGTITFSASGLPPNSTVNFSPASITAGGCSTSNTVAVSVLTQQGTVQQGAFATGAGGITGALVSLLGLAMAALIGLRRRNSALRFGRLWMVLALVAAASGLAACGNIKSSPRTPAGTYNITITATGSTGTTSSLNFPMTVQ